MDSFLHSSHLESLTGHLAYGLIFVSFLVRKMALLRTFAILASFSSIYFYYYNSSGTQWIPIKWNLVFISINCFHIVMHVLSKREIKLSESNQNTYSKYFTNLTPAEFLRILNVGHTRAYHPGSVLIEENQELPVLFLLMEGEASVYIENKEVAKLIDGDFIGEMSFITENKTRAKVVISKEAKIHFWEKEKLKDFLNKNPNLLSKFHGAIGNQLITKLISKSQMESKNLELPRAA